MATLFKSEEDLEVSESSESILHCYDYQLMINRDQRDKYILKLFSDGFFLNYISQ